VMASGELRQHLEEEAAVNPALEVVWDSVCPTCGRGLAEGSCWFCRRAAESGVPARGLEGSPPLTAARFSEGGDAFDALENVHRPLSLQEHVLEQARLAVAGGDLPIVEHLIADLSDDGLLDTSFEAVAESLGVELDRVLAVLSQLQTLEPPGICARSSQESLLIQLRELAAEQAVPAAAEPILRHHWRDLAHHAYTKIARTLLLPPEEVEEAVTFILGSLYPYPGRLYHSPYQKSQVGHSELTRPDVRIWREVADYHVEVVRPFDFEVRVSEAYQRYCASSRRDGDDSPERQAALESYRRATWLVQSLLLREETLRQIGEYIVTHQRPFLDTEFGPKLRPMTRTEVAGSVRKHVSTISRATANKYVLLPSGNLIPFDRLFAAAVAPKTVVAELLTKESPERPLTDEQIRRILHVRGFDVARRTVAKYRLALGLPSSTQRGRHCARVTR